MRINLDNFEGQCLVASPHLQGNSFEKSIVLVTHHEVTGTLGVVFNQPTNRRLGEFMTSIPDSLRDVVIHEGGPVEENTLTLIGLAFSSNTLKVSSHLDPVAAAKFLSAEAQGRQVRGYMGYAGWAAGQLESEILHGDWWIIPFTPALIEPMSKTSLWQWAVGSMG